MYMHVHVYMYRSTHIYIHDVFCTSLCSLMNSMGQPLAQGGSTMSPSGSPLCLVPTYMYM